MIFTIKLFNFYMCIRNIQLQELTTVDIRELQEREEGLRKLEVLLKSNIIQLSVGVKFLNEVFFLLSRNSSF